VQVHVARMHPHIDFGIVLIVLLNTRLQAFFIMPGTCAGPCCTNASVIALSIARQCSKTSLSLNITHMHTYTYAPPPLTHTHTCVP